MKKLFFVFTAVITAGIIAVSCNNNASTSKETAAAGTDTTAHAHKYRCPMNCEKGKTFYYTYGFRRNWKNKVITGNW